MSAVIENAKRRIKQVRQRDVELKVLKDGKPVENARVSFKMKNHQFLFGAVCYKYGTFETPEQNEKFTRLFTKLFNYTMVPYHWNWYEPKKGEYAEPYTGNLIKWAEKHHLKKKLHALIWHELCPEWVESEKSVKQCFFDRISHLMENYGSSFEFMDVVNETTVYDRFDNPVSRWIREYGEINVMKFGTELVRSYFPDTKLLYGEWNVREDKYYKLLDEMREKDVDIDILGVQSHMHSKRWEFDEASELLDKIAAYKWPLHFPECSICSGWPAHEIKFAAGAYNEWIEKEEDLYSQAEYAKDFYTLIFSHPAVEALSWFDFTEHRWLWAPAGVVDDNLDPKPVYHALYDLIHKEWHSNAECTTGTAGICKTRLFCGTYDIIVESDGKRKVLSADILRPSFYEGGGEPRRLAVHIE